MGRLRIHDHLRDETRIRKDKIFLKKTGRLFAFSLGFNLMKVILSTGMECEHPGEVRVAFRCDNNLETDTPNVAINLGDTPTV